MLNGPLLGPRRHTRTEKTDVSSAKKQSSSSTSWRRSSLTIAVSEAGARGRDGKHILGGVFIAIDVALPSVVNNEKRAVRTIPGSAHLCRVQPVHSRNHLFCNVCCG